MTEGRRRGRMLLLVDRRCLGGGFVSSRRTAMVVVLPANVVRVDQTDRRRRVEEHSTTRRTKSAPVPECEKRTSNHPVRANTSKSPSRRRHPRDCTCSAVPSSFPARRTLATVRGTSCMPTPHRSGRSRVAATKRLTSSIRRHRRQGSRKFRNQSTRMPRSTSIGICPPADPRRTVRAFTTPGRRCRSRQVRMGESEVGLEGRLGRGPPPPSKRRCRQPRIPR